MSWLTATYFAIGSACLTLAAIHAHVAYRQRRVDANAAFAVLAASVAGIAFVENRMLHADTTAEIGRMLWWYHWPVWSGMVAVVCFVRLYMRAGRAWLGWTAVALRTLTLIVNCFSNPSINFREITSIAKVSVFGDTVSVAQGIPNPWMAAAHLSLLALTLFVADAAWDVWRRGERRKAITIGGSLALFILCGTIMAVVSYWGLAVTPVLTTLFFVPIVVAMALELSNDLTNAVRTSAALDAKMVELHGSEQRVALAAEAANAGLWSVDAESGTLWGTPRALSMFELAPDRSHHVDDALRSIHPDDRERVRELFTSARSTDDLASVEFRVMTRDDDVRWYASRGRAHEGGPGAPGGLMGATIDITERKRAEDETARQRLALEHLSRVATLSELSGALAHEINQPLAVIMSNAEAAQRLLEQPDPDLPEIRAILDDIVGADERAGAVIGRLRGLLKRGTPNRQPVSPNEVVEGVLQFMRADLIRRGVAVELSLADSIADIRADRVLIEQVLINVIGNACDAMAANAAGDRLLVVSTQADAGAALVRIVDAGAGLPTPTERVFEAFYTTKQEGLGLGLAISRSIVASHGGRLWAEANAGRGATFHIWLPAVPGMA